MKHTVKGDVLELLYESWPKTEPRQRGLQYYCIMGMYWMHSLIVRREYYWTPIRTETGS